MFYTYMPAFTNDVTAIPASFLNRLRTDIGRAIDGTSGGSYTPSAVINVQGAGFGSIDVATKLEINVGGQLVIPIGTQISDVNNQTFTLEQGQVREFIASGGNRDHDLSTVGATAGSTISFVGLPANAGWIKLRRSGFAGNDIVTFPLGNWASATVYYDAAGNWRLERCSALAVPGADA